ncbi:MAG: formate--tetrahydrofolate ligase [Acidimicrobiia bacterium]|nr:formate--tetrahydrofolate ligase [Acidimicrobiia bacterium]
MSTFPTDIEIARSADYRPIDDVAEDMGIPASSLEHWGRNVAKISLDAADQMGPPKAKYVLVTATTPTPLGEGKTTVAVGLAEGFKHIDRKSVVTLRQPSQGPTFGIKGGAAGGGYSQIIPMESLNLHLTGDFHAVTAANNLLAAMADNHLHHGNELGFEIHNLTWRRVLDVNDRALRNVIVGLGTGADGIPRQGGFDITSASEIMAVLGLASDLKDLRARLGRLVVGFDRHRNAITAEDLNAAGAMAVLLKDALNPNLLQTLEGTPAMIHTGPFANIAHGNSSIAADRIAIKGGDYLITEAGFGADIGAEKFFNIKCRVSGMKPDAAVVVTTVKALKVQSGNHTIRLSHSLPAELFEENPAEVTAGAVNLRHHINIMRKHGVTPVVAINVFPTDHSSEHEAAARVCEEEGVRWALARPYSDGGEGMVDLARAVEDACEEGSDFQLLYPDDASLEKKIEAIATEVYGADGVILDLAARRQIKRAEDQGWGTMPICMAKTHLSLSHNSKLMGAPKGWKLPIREVRASVGAGFVLPLAGDIRTMPGLGVSPAAHRMDIDDDGNVIGLS